MTTKKPKTTQRSATVPGNLVTPLDPKFLTLTKFPANQRSFSIVRSADAEQTDMPDAGGEAQTTAPAHVERPAAPRRITRRADSATQIHLIEFPAGYSQEAAQAKMAEYGLVSYNLTAEEGKQVTAQRKDLQSIAKDDLLPMVLSEDGIKAYVKRGDMPADATPGRTKLAVVSFEFDRTKLTDEQITEFISRNAVDKQIAELDNSGDTVSVLHRSEVAEGEEVRRVEVEAGVLAVITRSDIQDIPDGFVAVINECAYGNWGWGQLDFLAIWSDRYVCSQVEEAQNMLRSVIDRIMFYSDLPLDARKALVSRAAAQFDLYLQGLLDMLPRQMLLAVGLQEVQRSDEVQPVPTTDSKEITMSGTAATTTNAAPAAAAQGITRAEVEQLLQAQNAAMADTVLQVIQRREAEAKAAQEKADAEAKAETERQEEIKRSAKAELDAALKPLQDEIEALKGSTIVRSAPEGNSEKPGAQAAPAAGTEIKRADGDLFVGVLPGLLGGQTTAQAAKG